MIKKIISVGFIVLSTSVIAFMTKTSDLTTCGIAGFGTIAGLFLGAIFNWIFVKDADRLVLWDGMFLIFTNASFNRAFKILNPGL